MYTYLKKIKKNTLLKLYSIKIQFYNWNGSLATCSASILCTLPMPVAAVGASSRPEYIIWKGIKNKKIMTFFYVLGIKKDLSVRSFYSQPFLLSIQIEVEQNSTLPCSLPPPDSKWILVLATRNNREKKKIPFYEFQLRVLPEFQILLQFLYFAISVCISLIGNGASDSKRIMATSVILFAKRSLFKL